jgi:hypothetical protein
MLSIGPFFYPNTLEDTLVDEAIPTITAGDSSSPGQSSSEELVSTVEAPPAMDADAAPQGGDKPEADADATPAGDKKPEGAEAQSGDQTPSGDDTRFDKHPRFVELNTRVKTAEEANARLMSKLAEVEAKLLTTPEPQQKTPEELPYKDVSGMTAEELLDWQSTDPQGFLENQQKQNQYLINQGIQTGIEAALAKNQEKETESRIETTYSSYAKENPDFEKMWDTGELNAFMQKNPGHNAISAHMILTEQSRREAAVKNAVAEALEKAETERKAKRKAVVLGAGPAAVPAGGDGDAVLKEPHKYGGATSVLASRLAARRTR